MGRIRSATTGLLVALLLGMAAEPAHALPGLNPPTLPVLGAPPPSTGSSLSWLAGAAFVDPLLQVELRAESSAVAILVLEPGASEDVLHRLRLLDLGPYHYEALDMVAVRVTAQALHWVSRIPGVTTIYRNEVAKPLLDRAVPYIGATTVLSTYRLLGPAPTVLVLDSGVDGSHPDVKYGYNLVENVVPLRHADGMVRGSREGVRVSDVHGHGTHVAGIVGGTGRAAGEDAPKYRGVLPSAKLLGYQAGARDASGEVVFDSVSVLEGFNYAIQNHARFGLRVVTNSWGANGDFDPRAPINQATLSLYKLGLVVIFAAGNEGGDGPQTLNKFSVAPWVLSVSAGDYLNRLAPFSSRGSDPSKSGRGYDHPDLVAPGLRITSANPVSTPGSGSVARAHAEPQYYRSTSGTSIAAPVVAGIAAMLVQANPRLSPDQVMDILTATATPMDGYAVWDAGAGYVNALQAYRLAIRTVGQQDTFLEGKVKYAGRESGDPRFERDAVSVGYGSGAAQPLRNGALGLGEFLILLVTTVHGVVFLIGVATLASSSFAWQRQPVARRAPWAPIERRSARPRA